MSFFSTLLRRLRDLAARLFGGAAPALPGAAERAALPEAAASQSRQHPSPPSPPVDAASSSAVRVVVEPPVGAAASASAVRVVVEPPVGAAASSSAVRVVVEPPVDAGASSSAFRLVAAPPVGAAASASAVRPGEALVADARPVLTVRRFFAQVAAAAPGGLKVDFSAWQGATVDRFFLALTDPERTRRRGPALAETVSVSAAFDGFEWD